MIKIPMHDKQGNNPFVADADGLVVAVLAIFSFFPSMAFAGFGLQAWTFLTLIVVGLVHFLTFFVGEIYRNVIKPEIVASRKKAEEQA